MLGVVLGSPGWAMGGVLTLDPVPAPVEMTPAVEGGAAVGVVAFNNLEQAFLTDAGSVYIETTFSVELRSKSDHSLVEVVASPVLYWSPTERLTLGFYASDVSYTSSSERDGMRWEGAGVQALYVVADTESSPVGVAVYSFIGSNERGFANDTRLVLEVMRGAWNLAYNLRLETAVDGLNGGGLETEGVLGHTFGVAYVWKRSASWVPEASLGLEVLVDSVYTEWRHYEGTSVYAGPTLGLVLGERCAVTLTGLVQLTDEDLPRGVVQVTVGWGF